VASRFWVGGTGTWDSSTTTNWSATSGGAGGASVPGASDDVTFDASSGGGTVTPNYNMTVTSITMGAFTGTLDFSANNKSPTMSTFDFSGTGVRTLNMGTGTFTITGSSACFNGGVNTNLTFLGGSCTIILTYSGASSRNISLGGGPTLGTVYVTGGSGIFNFSSSYLNGDLDFTGFVGLFQMGGSGISLLGNLTLGTGMTITSGGGSFSLNATTPKTLTTNSVVILCPVSIGGIGGTITLQDNLSISSAYTLTVTNGTLNANNFNVTCGSFSSSNSNTRTLTMGSGTWTLTGSGTTIWTTSTTTNLTLNFNTSTVNATYSGGTGTRTIITGGGGGGQLFNLSISAGTDAVNLTASGSVRVNGALNFTGFSGVANAGTSFLSGDVTFSPTMTWTGAGSLITLNPTSGIKTFTSNGVVINQPITVDGVGGTVQFADRLNMSGASSYALTLTNGTLIASANITAGSFASSNSNTRTLTMGSGTWTLTGNNATIWETGTATNLTLNINTCNVVCNYSGSTGTRTVNTLSGFAMPRFKITAGSDIFTLTGGGSYAGLDYTGFTGNVPTGSWQLNGNITLGVGMTFSASGSAIFCYNPCTITTNGVILTRSIQIDTAGTGGGTVTFTDNFNNTTSASGILLTSGALDANNKNITTQVFSSSNSNTRTLTMGSGTWQLTGTGTVWNTATTTGFTLNANTSTVKITDSSASSKTITSGVTSLYNLWLTGGGSGDMIIGTTTGTSTFNNITVDPILTVKVFAGKTIVAGSLSISGYTSNVNIFKSTTDTSAWSISVASGTVSADYISLRDSTATGGATFYAGANSTNVSGNTGWTFTDSPFKGSGLGRNIISNVISI